MGELGILLSRFTDLKVISKKGGRFFSNFVAFSEYLNFIRALGNSFFRDDCYIKNVPAYSRLFNDSDGW